MGFVITTYLKKICQQKWYCMCYVASVDSEIWHKKIVTLMRAASYFFLKSLSISLTITSFTLNVRVLNCLDFLMLFIQLQFNNCLNKCVRLRWGDSDVSSILHRTPCRNSIWTCFSGSSLWYLYKSMQCICSAYWAALFYLYNWYLGIAKNIFIKIFLSNPSCRRWPTIFRWVHI